MTMNPVPHILPGKFNRYGSSCKQSESMAVQLRGRAPVQVRSNFAYHFPHVSRTSSLLHCPDSDKWPRTRLRQADKQPPSGTQTEPNTRELGMESLRYGRETPQPFIPPRSSPRTRRPFLGRSGVQVGDVAAVQTQSQIPNPVRSNFEPELIEIENGQVEKVRKIVLVIYRAEPNERFPTVIPITNQASALLASAFLNPI